MVKCKALWGLSLINSSATRHCWQVGDGTLGCAGGSRGDFLFTTSLSLLQEIVPSFGQTEAGRYLVVFFQKDLLDCGSKNISPEHS